MKVCRWSLSLLVVAALVVAVARPRPNYTTAPVETPCTATALSAAFTGAERVTAVASYACEDGWAYLWATIGSGPTAVGVTEVLHYDRALQQWRSALRAKVCSAKIMPHYIYEQGCFSN
jgi:hypothetical protein